MTDASHVPEIAVFLVLFAAVGLSSAIGYATLRLATRSMAREDRPPPSRSVGSCCRACEEARSRGPPVRRGRTA